MLTSYPAKMTIKMKDRIVNMYWQWSLWDWCRDSCVYPCCCQTLARKAEARNDRHSSPPIWRGRDLWNVEIFQAILLERCRHPWLRETCNYCWLSSAQIGSFCFVYILFMSGDITYKFVIYIAEIRGSVGVGESHPNWRFHKDHICFCSIKIILPFSLCIKFNLKKTDLYSKNFHWIQECFLF